MDQRQAPLWDKIVQYDRSDPVRGHVPGHAGKQPVDSLEAAYYEAIRRIDLTEVDELDDLHHPSGVIREAERLAAAAFGAEETKLLVGGSTAGNLAMILGTVSTGELLLVQRNCHKSVLHGLMLAGAEAVFLAPTIDPGSGLACGVRPEQVEEAIYRYPSAKGVLLTNPTYYGMGIDLRPIAACVHRHGVPLLVDEAHGAHYGFHPAYPPSALSAGADVAVQSTHKMLSALTMGAMLHMQGDLANRERIVRILSMLQSSSPSYPILASLDTARREVALEGKARLAVQFTASEELKRWVRSQTSLAFLEQTPNRPYSTLDPLKLTLYDRGGRWSGYRLQEQLRRHGVQTELADPRHVLLHLSLWTEQADLEAIRKALLNISETMDGSKQEIIDPVENIMKIPIQQQPISEPVTFQPATSPASQRELIPLAEAVGRKAAAMVVPYPPGIPVLYAGEAISSDTARYVQTLADCGAVFQGLGNPALHGIPVLVERGFTKESPGMGRKRESGK